MESLGGKRYACVCVDDYSRYTWEKFMCEKSKAFKVSYALFLHVQREHNTGIVCILVIMIASLRIVLSRTFMNLKAYFTSS